MTGGAWAGSAVFDAMHTPPVTAELGPTVASYAELSPFLRQQLADLRADGWTIGYGASHANGETRIESKTIVIDESLKDYPMTTTAVLAHEVGHAYPGRVDTEALTPLPDEDYDSWLDRNLRMRRLSEADAELVAAQVRWEIMDDGGPDIGVIDDIAVRLHLANDVGTLSRDEARERMAEHLDGSSFDYYRTEYEKLWDRRYALTRGPSEERLERTGSSVGPHPYRPDTTDQ
ncbi:DUF6782 family putative metallopeptidase [Nocardia fusca]|uniref:DUF6782 family putative metallopeptidase n=1 Tax=Nocardia fusca TaxID=941183 RepID=UPI0037A919BD